MKEKIIELLIDTLRKVDLPANFPVVLSKENAELFCEELSKIISEIYHDGYMHGLVTYAHMKDGTYYVGTIGRTLKKAMDDDPKNGFNYCRLMNSLFSEVSERIKSRNDENA